MSDSRATLLQGGRVVSADGEYDADVLIVGEKIAAVGEVEAPSGATVLDVDLDDPETRLGLELAVRAHELGEISGR